jgi:hypothetical protein
MTPSTFTRRFFLFFLLALCAFSQLENAQAGLTLQFDFIHDCNAQVYTLAPNLSTNDLNGDSTPVTYHQVFSPFTNFAGGVGDGAINSRSGYDNFAQFMNLVTNGHWTLVLNVGATNQQTYTFTVRVDGLTSNLFASAIIDYPVDGTQNVAPLPDFEWHGPTNTDSLFVYAANANYSVFQYAFPATTVTNTSLPPALNDGLYTFYLDYSKDVTSSLNVSTLKDNQSNSLAGWMTTAQFDIGNQANFYVVTPVPPGGHSLVAHYAFDDANNLGKDSSPNGNDIYCYSYWGPLHTFTTNAVVGGGALQFFGSSSLTPCGQAFNAWTNTFAHSFSISLWMQTTNRVGNDGDSLYDYTGQSIIYADNNDTGATVGLIGGDVAFRTTDPQGNDDSLDSSQEVTTNHYVHVVVTRDEATGQKRIYINGVMNAFETASTNALFGATYVSIGGETGSAYTGLLDDVQIYSGVLNQAEVTYLYQNPGSNAPHLELNGLVVHYAFDDTNNIGLDSSGNGFNLDYNGTLNATGVSWNSDAAAGPGAAYFDGGSFLSYQTMPPSLISALAGSCTVSLWVQTSLTYGNDYDYAFDGAGIVAADVPGLANDIVPVALTGGAIGFNTGGDMYGDDTLNTWQDINDGVYHHVVVTRNQATGEKIIYIDGVLNTSDTATTEVLNDSKLLAIGCGIDASVADPGSASTFNYYQGLLDDLQIYRRVLSSNEVAYLYNNPGKAITTIVSNSVPTSLQFTFSLYRQQDPSSGDEYYIFPQIFSVTPSPVTQDRVRSPNGYFNGSYDSTNGSSAGSDVLNSLAQVIQEITNGLWTLTVNAGDLNQEDFHFKVSVSGLNTNVLAPCTILFPTNGATGVSANPQFQWTGPANFSSISADVSTLSNSYYSNLTATSTTWNSPSTLPAGTNYFYLSYVSNNFQGVTFTTPVDDALNQLSSWTTEVDIYSGSYSQFVIAGNPLLQLMNVQAGGSSLQFSFTTVANRTNDIETRTNLISGAWVSITNFVGDGSLRQFSFPTTNPPVRFFRVRVH